MKIVFRDVIISRVNIKKNGDMVFSVTVKPEDRQLSEELSCRQLWSDGTLLKTTIELDQVESTNPQS